MVYIQDSACPHRGKKHWSLSMGKPQPSPFICIARGCFLVIYDLKQKTKQWKLLWDRLYSKQAK